MASVLAGARTLVRWPVLRTFQLGARGGPTRQLAISAVRWQKDDSDSYVVMTGTFKCHKPNCPLCQHVVETKIVTSKVSGKSYKIPDYVTCDSSNVNYMIECLKCGMQYVGSTGRKVRLRGSEHVYDVQSGRYSAVSNHFNQTDHSVFDLAIIFIQRALRKKDRRLLSETELITLLRTVTPDGMNKIMPILRHTMQKESKALVPKQSALPMKTKPKMTWLQTGVGKEEPRSPFDSTPKRHFHRTPIEGDMLEIKTLDENGRASRSMQTMKPTSKCTNHAFFGKVLKTLEMRKVKKKQVMYNPKIQYGMMALLTLMQW